MYIYENILNIFWKYVIKLANAHYPEYKTDYF